jgi:hypothetical protein
MGKMWRLAGVCGTRIRGRLHDCPDGSKHASNVSVPSLATSKHESGTIEPQWEAALDEAQHLAADVLSRKEGIMGIGISGAGPGFGAALAVTCASLFFLGAQVAPAIAQSSAGTELPGDLFNTNGEDVSLITRNCALSGLGTVVVPGGDVLCANGNPSVQSGNIVTGTFAPNARGLEILSGILLALGDANSEKEQIALGESVGLSPEALQLLNNIYSTTPPSGGTHLGMYVSPGGQDFTSFGGEGGGFAVHNNGYGITDTAGLLAPGSATPSSRSVNGNGGINGSYDASRFLPTNQRLLFSGYFDYSGNDITFGPTAGLAAASAGSVRADTYTFKGAVLYTNDTAYLQGLGGFGFGNGHEAQTVDGSSGSFNFHNESADLQVGNIFVLSGSTPSRNSSIITKAPPARVGGYTGYTLGLDLSGHIGYFDNQIDGFTDSTGFAIGTGQTRYGDIGARAQLFQAIPGNGFVWVPYVAATIDRQFDFSSTLTIPNQAALPGGDLVSLTEAQTFWGAHLGLDVLCANGWTVGVNGFYTASSDTSFSGASAHIKIPFNYTPTVASRY